MGQRLQSNIRRDKFNYTAVIILTRALSVKISYFREFINYRERTRPGRGIYENEKRAEYK